MPEDDFCADAWRRSDNRNKKWYQENLMPVLLEAKEQRAREIDASIDIAKQLLQIYNEKIVSAPPTPVYEYISPENDNFMKPIEADVLNLIYGSTEKGFGQRYLTVRNKKAPEDRYYNRLCSNWDYGWQQKHSHVRAREVNRGRCPILRDTFYRKNNLAPDPRHYSQPAGGAFSICSEYSCNFS